MRTSPLSAGLAALTRTLATTRQLILRGGRPWSGLLALAAMAFAAQPAQAAVTEAWVHRHSNVVSLPDWAVKVVRDAAGDIIVTGTTSTGIPGVHMLTIKYSGADGAVLWKIRYNSPANGGDVPTALAVDGSGNVVVTGYSYGTNSDRDYYTAKYAAADGALLWERRFTGPASVGDSPHCLALGPDGMVAVTGTSNGGYATVVYREVPEAVSIDLVATGLRLRFTGASGRGYHIDRATALTGPWSTLDTQTASASGAFEYLDTNPPRSAAFYRASEP